MKADHRSLSTPAQPAPVDPFVRPAIHRDLDAILAVQRAAFGREQEADLVAALLSSGHAVCNLVALLDQQVVGHVLFTLVQAPEGARLVGLAPLAVAPSAQQNGIGAALVFYAWPMLRDAGFDGVVVVGDPAYYARFGFVPASQWGLTCAQALKPAHFLACALAPDALAHIQPGAVTYAAEFDGV